MGARKAQAALLKLLPASALQVSDYELPPVQVALRNRATRRIWPQRLREKPLQQTVGMLGMAMNQPGQPSGVTVLASVRGSQDLGIF